MTNQSTILQSAAFVILQREGKILLIRRANSGWNGGYYDLPSGTVRGGEANTTAAARVAREALGVGIEPADLEFALVTHGLYPDGKESYDVYFRAPRWTDEPQAMQQDIYDAVGWFSLDSLPDNLTPSAQLALELVRGGVPYAEFGFPELGVPR